MLPLILGFTLLPTGIEYTVTYTEPTSNSDSTQTPLTDLGKTTIYYDIATDGLPPIKAKTVSASSVLGGKVITQKVIVPILPGQESDVSFYATATDKSGNESIHSLPIIKRGDRLVPSSPQ